MITKSENIKTEILTILFAQKKTLITVTLLIFAAGILIAFFWPPTYSASGSILIKMKRPLRSPDEIEGVEKRYTKVDKEDLASEVEIIRSPEVIERALRMIKYGKILDDSKTIKISNENLHQINKQLKTEIAPSTNVINLTYYDKDPEYAVKFLDSLLKSYVKYRMELYYPKESSEYFKAQAGDFSTDIDKKNKEWIEIIEKNKIAQPLKEIESNLLVKKELESSLNQLKAQKIELANKIKYLDTALAYEKVQFFSFLNQESFINLSESVKKLYIEWGNITRKYLPDSEAAETVENQLNTAMDKLKNEVRIYRNGLDSELKSIKSKINYYENRISDITVQNVELQKQNILNQKIAIEMNLLQSSYETFSKRREEANIGMLIPESSYVNILKKAFPSDGPVFPEKNTLIPLSLFVGFLTGFALAFIKEYFDYTFKRVSEIEELTGLKVLFSVSEHNRNKR